MSTDTAPRWADASFADFCAHMRAGGTDWTDTQFLAEAAMIMAGPGECGNPFPVTRWAAEVPQVTVMMAMAELLQESSRGLPDMDDPEDGEELPRTDDGYIARAVDEERAAVAMANAFSAAYDDQALEDGAPLVGPLSPAEEAAAAAGAVLEIEEHRKACRAAVELLGAHWEGTAAVLPGPGEK